MIFLSLLAPFNVQNFKKIFRVDPKLWERNVILGPKWPIYPNQVFFSKNYQFKFHVPFGTFHSAKLKKKSLERIQSYEDMPFLGPKMTRLPWKIISSENPFINLVALSIYMQKIRVRCQSINEILTIKEYWNLIGREHFWPWLENLIFPTYVVFAEC